MERFLDAWLSSCLILIFLPVLVLSITIHNLTPRQVLRDGDTLVSPLGVFELGFFTPNGSTNRYVGIWYKHIPVFTVVWVANRNSPLRDSSSALKLSITGNLTINNSTGFPVWFSNSNTTFLNPIAQLLDSGNFIVQDGRNEVIQEQSIVWQSFDYPTNTWLLGMKLLSKSKMSFTSWKDATDASEGDHSFTLDPEGLHEMVIRQASVTKSRFGYWNGLSLTGSPEIAFEQKRFSYISDDGGSYFVCESTNGECDDEIMIIHVLDQSGFSHKLQWINRTQSWEVIKRFPRDMCDGYGTCGAYGLCNSEWPTICECLVGFMPRSPSDWKSGDWSGGCVRKTDLDCHSSSSSSSSSSDWFLNVGNMKPPDSSNNLAVVNRGLSFQECRLVCLMNCSCVAFASERIDREDGGCVMWVGELIDIRQFTYGGHVLYIRLAASELGDQSHNVSSNNGTSKKKLLEISTASAVSFVLAVLCTCFCFVRRNALNNGETRNGDIHPVEHTDTMLGDASLNLSEFTYASVVAATNNFSLLNKLGEGGFGPVYKGHLPDGQEVAVKRLADCSTQGEQEFMNEAILIARLQHTNLVRLIGVCSQRGEKMLIYEYMPNKSLDSILFDPIKGELLDWPRRKQIIVGIAQGLLYLHKYSRLKIIHRDLKAGNILLDVDWNPKISDFGIAKIFSGKHNQDKTNRVVGTYGYMSPEYALLGRFSEKSDVFSFGVLLLEIVSGRKNTSFHHNNGPCHLIQYAWDLWRNGPGAVELVDRNLGNLYPNEEIRIFIKIGLLCVQEAPDARPTMPAIVSFLGVDDASIPTPNRPAFYPGSELTSELDMNRISLGSSNAVTFSSLVAR